MGKRPFIMQKRSIDSGAVLDTSPIASRTLREAVVEFLMGPWDMNGGRRTQSRPTFDELLARATRVVKLKSWKIN
jgi:hypothetical protein